VEVRARERCGQREGRSWGDGLRVLRRAGKKLFGSGACVDGDWSIGSVIANVLDPDVCRSTRGGCTVANASWPALAGWRREAIN
jgi:hypothetical protein